jgi:C-terminal processing protease CtpA/Prc
MSVMGRQPAVTFVGENTQGVYSEIVGRTLPNGWNVSLPTEVYETAAGRSFDGVGVAPDIRVNALRQEDLDAGKDPILERALVLLR